MWILYILIAALWGVAWGVTTYTIIVNRGYHENWFWWGFFFGIFAALVALSKADCHSKAGDQSLLYYLEKEEQDKKILQKDGWKCICGRANPSYTGTCSCGKSILEAKKNQLEEKAKLMEKQQIAA